MRVIKARKEEPESQTQEELFSSPFGVSVVGVTSLYRDGTAERAVYLEKSDDPERFDILGIYDGTPAGQHQSQSTAFIAARTLEVLAELRA